VVLEEPSEANEPRYDYAPNPHKLSGTYTYDAELEIPEPESGRASATFSYGNSQGNPKPYVWDANDHDPQTSEDQE
jgi:hypothetical protein